MEGLSDEKGMLAVISASCIENDALLQVNILDFGMGWEAYLGNQASGATVRKFPGDTSTEALKLLYEVTRSGLYLKEAIREMEEEDRMDALRLTLEGLKIPSFSIASCGKVFFT